MNEIRFFSLWFFMWLSLTFIDHFQFPHPNLLLSSCAHMCAHACGARVQCRLCLTVVSHLTYEIGSPTEPGTHLFGKMSSPEHSGTPLSPSPQHWADRNKPLCLVQVDVKDLNSQPHVLCSRFFAVWAVSPRSTRWSSDALIKDKFCVFCLFRQQQVT